MDVSKLNYSIKDDILFYIDSSNSDIESFCSLIKISKATLYEIISSNSASEKMLEKIYSFIYDEGYRLNSVKEELLKESHDDAILFHGSKEGLITIKADGSRPNCDFGPGFYLGESYGQAASFVCENAKSSIYSFNFENKKLKVAKFNTDLEWMIAICCYRGMIKEYENAAMVTSVRKKVQEADLIIAPIADNRMFYIMSSFAKGDINCDVAIHSLSASKLGLQYIFKTDSSIKCLKPIDKYYLSESEKKDIKARLNQRAEEIETKLKMSQREYRNGKFIEEVLG